MVRQVPEDNMVPIPGPENTPGQFPAFIFPHAGTIYSAGSQVELTFLSTFNVIKWFMFNDNASHQPAFSNIEYAGWKSGCMPILYTQYAGLNPVAGGLYAGNPLTNQWIVCRLRIRLGALFRIPSMPDWEQILIVNMPEHHYWPFNKSCNNSTPVVNRPRCWRTI